MKKQLHDSEEHFKRKLEGYEAPFEPKAFHEFTKRLDDAPEKKKYRWLGFFSAAMLFIIIGALIGSLFIYNKMSKNKLDKKEKTTYSALQNSKDKTELSNNAVQVQSLVRDEDASILKRNNQLATSSLTSNHIATIDTPSEDVAITTKLSSEVGPDFLEKTNEKRESISVKKIQKEEISSAKANIKRYMNDLLEQEQDQVTRQIEDGDDYTIRITENLKINNQVKQSKFKKNINKNSSPSQSVKPIKHTIDYLPLLPAAKTKLLPVKTERIPSAVYEASIVPLPSDEFDKYFTLSLTGILFSDESVVTPDPFFGIHQKKGIAPYLSVAYRMSEFLSAELGYIRKKNYTGFSVLSPYNEVDEGRTSSALSSQILSAGINLHIPIIKNLVELIPSVSYAHMLVDRNKDLSSEGFGSVAISNNEISEFEYNYNGTLISSNSGLLEIGAAVSLQLSRVVLVLTYKRFIGREDVYTQQYNYAMPESKQQQVDYTYTGGFTGLGLGVNYNFKR